MCEETSCAAVRVDVEKSRSDRLDVLALRGNLVVASLWRILETRRSDQELEQLEEAIKSIEGCGSRVQSIDGSFTVANIIVLVLHLGPQFSFILSLSLHTELFSALIRNPQLPAMWIRQQ